MPPGILGAHKPSGVARRARRRRNVDSPAAAAATGPMSVTGRSQGGRSRLTTPTVRLNHAGRPSPGEVGPGRPAGSSQEDEPADAEVSSLAMPAVQS